MNKVGIVAFPICDANEPLPNDTKAANVTFSNLVDVLHYLFGKLYVITGDKRRVLFKKDDKMQVFEIRHRGGTTVLTRLTNYVYTQLKLSFELARLSKHVHLWIFFMGAEALILPLVTARLLRKQAVLTLTGFPSEVHKQTRDPFLTVIGLMMKFNLALSSSIIVFSERIISEQNLGSYRNKIFIASQFTPDFNRLYVKKPLSERDMVVGFIGRLSLEKGILNFLAALPKILTKEGDGISVLIGGDGPLRSKVEKYLRQTNLSSKVNFVGWISESELPQYLNDLRLLVIPSYTEALPNIMLEAMACGTPILTTAVGAIPDVIKDGETGFIMENNLPDTIAKNVTSVLHCQKIERVAINALAYVKKEYNFENAVNGYRRAFLYGR